MNKYKILMAMVAVLFFTFACEDEDRLPIVVLDTVEKGAYPRLIDETSTAVNLYDVAGSSYTYNIEFIDEQRGGLVAAYVLEVVYDDNDPSNGDNSTDPQEWLRYTSDQFTNNANNYLQAPETTISATEVISRLGLDAASISSGDQFEFIGRVELTDGRVFSQTNSSPTVVGPAFRGHFNFTMTAFCPSDLGGTVNYSTTSLWCDTTGAVTVTGTVDIAEQSTNGVYKFSDWAFGAYPECYGNNSSPTGNLTFTETCGTVAFTGFKDDLGATWTFNSSVDGSDWTIEWSNSEGEAGVTVLSFSSAVPFTVE